MVTLLPCCDTAVGMRVGGGGGGSAWCVGIILHFTQQFNGVAHLCFTGRLTCALIFAVGMDSIDHVFQPHVALLDVQRAPPPPPSRIFLPAPPPFSIPHQGCHQREDKNARQKEERSGGGTRNIHT